MFKMTTLKSFILAGMIGLGLFAQTKAGQAQSTEKLTVAGGCFWCVEADFERVKGVKEAVSGYTGGTVKILPTRKFRAAIPATTRLCRLSLTQA